MFEGFTTQTSDFLWELAFHNERPWFLAHKEQFEQVLNRPLKALAADTAALMEQRFPSRGFKLHVSRIYRDARRLFGRGPYKDHLWFSLRRRDWNGDLCFYFTLSASSYGYGLGGWMRAHEAENWRRFVDANGAEVERLARRLSRRKDFALGGESYKRPKGDKSGILGEWYNKRDLEIGCQHDFGEALFDTALPEKLAEGYGSLLPYARLFAHAYTE